MPGIQRLEVLEQKETPLGVNRQVPVEFFDEEMVPSPDIARRIIFMNCGTEAAMKEQIESYILRQLTRVYDQPDIGQNVIEVLRLVDQSYGQQKRRTGERFGCHLYRACAEFIHWATREQDKDRLGADFWAQDNGLRPFYVGILGAALHDAGEDLSGGSTFKIIDGSICLPAGKISLASLGLLKEEGQALAKTVQALTKPPKPAREIDARTRTQQKFEKFYWGASRLKKYGRWFGLLPYIIKLTADSRDNNRTEFEKSDGSFKIGKDQLKLKEKLAERRYFIRQISRLLERNDLKLRVDLPLILILHMHYGFDQIYKPCFEGQPEGKLAFFDPFGKPEPKFEFA